MCDFILDFLNDLMDNYQMKKDIKEGLIIRKRKNIINEEYYKQIYKLIYSKEYAFWQLRQRTYNKEEKRPGIFDAINNIKDEYFDLDKIERCIISYLKGLDEYYYVEFEDVYSFKYYNEKDEEMWHDLGMEKMKKFLSLQPEFESYLYRKYPDDDFIADTEYNPKSEYRKKMCEDPIFRKWVDTDFEINLFFGALNYHYDEHIRFHVGEWENGELLDPDKMIQLIKEYAKENFVFFYREFEKFLQEKNINL